jgi:Fe-S-cluster containining protein
MPDCSKSVSRYHSLFEGDTYDACARCGGKCEIYKVSTLLPGEKQYMASYFNMPLCDFENKYLDCLDTPYGKVDVLKMKNGCPFLDKEYHCTALPVKPVLCDSYPIVMDIKGNRIEFRIDQHDCPMVHWPEYEKYVRNFAENGTAAMRQLDAPLEWWKLVMLYDEYDFDYVRIEKELRHSPEYETFFIEDILSYACNGYEKRARQAGLKLFSVRIKSFLKTIVDQINDAGKQRNSFAKRLATSYKDYLKDYSFNIIKTLDTAFRDELLLTEKSGFQYSYLSAETKDALRCLESYGESFLERIKQVNGDSVFSENNKDSVQLIEKSSTAFFIKDLIRKKPGYNPYEILDFSCRPAKEGYALLARWFAPDEIDGPGMIVSFMKDNHKHNGKISSIGESGNERPIWYRWIMVVLVDAAGKVVSAADGAVIADRKNTIFYASHIATVDKLRSKGLGSFLNSYVWQAANNHLVEAKAALGDCDWSAAKQPILKFELSEVEFPDPGPRGEGSMRRLTFHGKSERKVIWPYRYAQPDTDYHLDHFDSDAWNSVPMFLCVRAFTPKGNKVQSSLEAADLMLDYFSVCGGGSMGKGIEWDRVNIKYGLLNDTPPKLVPFPTKKEAIPTFVSKTGYFQQILPEYYKNHRYTIDRLETFALANRAQLARKR